MSKRVRMTSAERREQLIEVARPLFAQLTFDGTTVEEIAAQAGVSKPVVYEHFGGKEGLYAVVVDREVNALIHAIRASLSAPGIGPRDLVERAALATLTYIEENPDGFRIISRDSSVGGTGGTFATILSDIAGQVEDILAASFSSSPAQLDPRTAPLYAQALVGMVALAGQWWLDTRKPSKQEVAAHLVNLAWYGMRDLERKPTLRHA